MLVLPQFTALGAFEMEPTGIIQEIEEPISRSRVNRQLLLATSLSALVAMALLLFGDQYAHLWQDQSTLQLSLFRPGFLLLIVSGLIVIPTSVIELIKAAKTPERPLMLDMALLSIGVAVSMSYIGVFMTLFL
ncbi:hypothetical protein TUM17377_18150 [Shewanella chilikensis]|nr:hypothetical protein TUM17377_18150 [Shewanella chilikensis]